MKFPKFKHQRKGQALYNFLNMLGQSGKYRLANETNPTFADTFDFSDKQFDSLWEQFCSNDLPDAYVDTGKADIDKVMMTAGWFKGVDGSWSHEELGGPYSAETITHLADIFYCRGHHAGFERGAYETEQQEDL